VRILLTTRGSSGHLLPLAPIGHACLQAGHDVLVTAQRQHRANVERERLPFSPVGDPPDEEWMPLLDQFGELGIDAADARMIRDFFGGIDTRAALPDLLRVVESWRPDVIVRETWEYASTIAAELNGVPLARVGLGLAALEQRSVRLVAPAVDDARAKAGLPPDPSGERLRDTPYLTFLPELFDDAGDTGPGAVYRFRAPSSDAVPPARDWLPAGDDPLVYLSFGSVAAGAHLPYFPELYRAAIDALAALPVRLLVTIGEDRDPAELAPWPKNVRVERWVPQDAVAPLAAAIVGHGGHGSTLGALSHGVPLVVMPLFSGDQWDNAEAVARAGAGIALDTDRATRQVLALPGSDTLGGLAAAVRSVLEDGSYRSAAERIADAIAALPPAGAAVDVLAAISATTHRCAAGRARCLRNYSAAR